MKNNFKVPFRLLKENLKGKDDIKIALSEDVTFLNKASILKTLEQIQDNTSLEIAASLTRFIHYGVFEIIEDFMVSAEHRNIKVSTIELYDHKQKEPLHHFKLDNQDQE